jgi:tetratricopeptide (TPR) repeat protein
LGVGVAAADSGLFGSSHPAPSNHPARNLNAARPRTPTTVRHARVRKHHAAPQARPTTTTTSTVQASPAAVTTPPPTADTLQAQGHDLLQDGNYAAAIPVIRRALSTASPASVTYAYALFDLGRALLLSGDPKAAVEVLWQRMQIPNQTDVVRAELQDALRALGQQANAGGPPGAPSPPGGPAHRHGGGHGEGHGAGAGSQGPFS